MRDWMVLAASALLLMPSVKSFADEPLLRFGVVSDIHVTAADDLAASRFAVDNVRFSVVPVDSLGCRGCALTGGTVQRP